MSTASLRPLRAVAYFRISTINGQQHRDKEESIEQQEAWAESTAAKEGVTLLGRFTDQGVRGYDTARRDGFRGMLEFCRQQKQAGQPIEVIVCYAVDRFSRADGLETAWFVQEFRNVGVRLLLTAARWFNFDKQEDRFVLTATVEYTAHSYSLNLARSSTRAKLARAEQGRFCGGRCPYGYRVVYREEQTRKGRRLAPERLEIDPDRAAVVRWLFTAYSSGTHSLRTLAQTLNDRHEPTPSAVLKGKKTSPLWTAQTIRLILGSEVYLGRLVWGRTNQGRFLGVVDMEIRELPHSTGRVIRPKDPSQFIRRASHEPLIDEATWQLCQRRLVEQRRNTTPRQGGGNLVLTRLLLCGHCGRRMTGRHLRGKPIYLCSGYLQFGKTACNFNSMAEGPLLNALVRKIQDRFTPGFLDECRKRLKSAAGTPTDVTDTARLSRRLTELERQLSTVARRAATEEDERLASIYRQEALSLQDEHDRITGELETARQASQTGKPVDAVVDAAIGIIAQLDKVISRATPAEVRAILRDHIEKVELWFTHEHRPHQTDCTFARGMIWLREDSPLASCLSTSHGICTGNACASTTMAGTPTRKTSPSCAIGTSPSSIAP